MSETQPTSLYDAIGGRPTFERLVGGFYDRVKRDDILGPMYPADDWDGAQERLTMFLTQYWGGPRDYQATRGNPMLRRRHFPFPIDRAAADRWLEIMASSLAEIDDATIDEPHRAALWEHMQRVAAMMINR